MRATKILIVEDNIDNSVLIEKILNHYGFETHICSTGQLALDYCSTHIPDLILMDLSLPDFDGLEITKKLKEKKEFANVPIIAVTAYAFREVEELTSKNGFSGFIVKPFIPADFIEVVRQHVQNPSTIEKTC